MQRLPLTACLLNDDSAGFSFSSFFLYTYVLSECIYFHNSKNYLSADNPQVDTFNPDLTSELQIQICNCILDISTEASQTYHVQRELYYTNTPKIQPNSVSPNIFYYWK